MQRSLSNLALGLVVLLVSVLSMADPYPPTWSGGAGPAVHYDPVAWPNEPADPKDCGDSCQDWKPYTRFDRSANDPRTQDPSNGGTAPQGYVNVASSCGDKTKPSIYYYLHQGATEADDVLMFRWRVEASPQNYATGPSAGNYGASNPWSSALWTVLFDLDGSGYRSLAAHLDGSSGSPSAAVDRLVGIWSNTPSQSLDYVTDPNVHMLGHNPTAFIGPTGKILNFGTGLSPTETWSNGANETVWNYGTTRARLVSSNSCNEYFVDYQIPIAMLDASGVGGPTITRSTPIAMLFCTANSLNNPFQKDCAINRTWVADASKPAPFGDYISFNQTEPYVQPIVSNVTALAPNSCPGTYTLKATVQDALAVVGGVVVPSVQAVDFFYWYDADGDGQADDTGSAWTKITPTATLDTGTMNKWTASWDASALPKGKYLVGVQAVDDDTKIDDDMTASGVDNRTFSYLSGDSANKVYINGTGWMAGQQPAFPTHSPSQAPSSGENWYGNPDVTGQQVAVVGTAINACGVAPTITYSANVSSVVAGGTVQYTLTVANPSTNTSAVTVSDISAVLPSGFSYQTSTSLGSGGFTSANPSTAGQTLTWTFGSPVSVAAGASATMVFDVTASSTSGNYNSTAGSTTSFGSLTSDPVGVAVDSARVSLTATPSAYSIAANGSTQLTITYAYSNDSTVSLTGAQITSALPAGVTYVSCGGGCSNSSGTLTWTLGTLAGGDTGSVTVVMTVPSSYSSSSVAETATLTATAPDSSTVTKAATATVAVTGYTIPGVAQFSLTKSASAVRVAPGATITYTLSYQNYGTASASGVAITDTLPDGFAYTSSTGSGVNSNGTVTWSVGTVAAGASGSVTVTATVASAATFTYPNPAQNDATISWTGGTPVTSNTVETGVSGNYCSAIFYFHQGADNVVSTVRPATQTAPSTSTDYITSLTGISDNTFDSYTTETNQVVFEQSAGLGQSLDISGQTLTISYYLSASQGGGRAQVILRNATTNTTIATSNEQTLSTGATPTLYSFSATVPASTTIGASDKLRWYFQFRASGGKDISFHYDNTTYNSRSSFCQTSSPASLSVSNTVDDVSIDAGTTPVLTYTLNYANNGGTTSTSTALLATLPTGMTGCQYSTDGSTWSTCSGVGGSPQTHTFSLGTSGSLAAGGSGTVYVRGTAPSGSTGGETLTATAAISSTQTTTVSSTATTTVAGGVVGGTPSLALGLSATPTLVQPSSSVTYSVTVTNVGDATASNVVVSNALPVASYYTYNNDCSGSCNNSSNTLSWTVGSLAAGASQTYTYSMLVGSSGLSAGVTTVTDNASASGDSGLSATSNDTVVSINGNPTLSGTLTATPNSSLTPGATITYTLVVQNTGNVSATNVVVTDPIPTYTHFLGSITASVGSGSFDTVNNRMVYSVGTLVAGATATLSYQVTVGALSSGSTTITNTATASASNAAQRTFSTTAGASASATLTLSQTASGTTAYPAASLTANANGTTLLVDHAERFSVGQYIKVGSTVAIVTGVGTRSLLVNTSITASSGANVIGAIALSLNYSNTGNTAATSTSLSDDIPTGLTYYTASPAADSAPSVGSSGTVTWSLGSVSSGGSGSRTVYVFPNGTTGTLTANGSISASNATTVTADADVIIGGLTVTKSTTSNLLSAGGIAHYVITVSNSLGVPVSSVDVTDTLPTGFSYRPNTATVASVLTEPALVGVEELTWSGLTIPASGSVVIAFDADVSAIQGASSYNNAVSVTAPAGVGVQQFDELQSTDENVSVLAANRGVLKGYVFNRTTGVGASYVPAADVPLSGVRVEIYQTGADCSNAYNSLCFVVYTDSSGYFEKTLAAEDWYVKVIPGTGDLISNWTQAVGNNDTLVSVPDQSEVWDHNGFTAPSSHTVTFDLDGGTRTGGGALSQTVADGAAATAPTLTPPTGKVFSSWSTAFSSVTTDLTVTAIYVDATYTVTFDLDGGTRTGGGALSQTVTHGTAATAPTLTPPTGKVFSSWSTTFSSVTSNLTVTAIYVDATYTVTFDLDGGTRTGGGALSQTVTHGSAATAPTLTPPLGKVFSAWDTSFSSVTSNLTVTAVYVDATFTVTFDLDGGARTGGGTLSQSVIYATAATAPTLTPPTGKVFSSWDTSFSSVTSNLTVTAIYVDATYTVTFDLDGGTRTGGGALSQSVTHGTAATAPTLTPPTGKVFSSWDTSFSSVTSNLTVTAIYVDATYTVTFDLDGGSRTGGGALSQSVTHGTAATAPTLTPPTGKVFSSWDTSFSSVTSNLTVTAVYVDATYTVTFDLDGGTRTGGGALSQSVTHGTAATAPTLTPPTGKVFSSWSTTFSSVTSNLTVTAIYVDATYTVTFDLDGGTRTGGGALSQSVTHGSAATAPTLTPPTGKVFSSWSTTFSSVTSNLTVTAIYVDATYTVTFDLDGGTRTGGGALSQSVTHGSAATAPTLTPPTGKVFSSWSTTFSSVTSNLTVTAIYVDATYTVTFDLDGGTRTGGGALSQSVTHGSAATAPTLTPPTGKVFSSWSTTFSSVTSNLTVTAIYVDATYTVTFDLDGGTRTGGGALSQSVTHGSAATAPTLTPPTGKVFSSWSTTFSSVTSNLTVTAIYVDATYTVTFDLDGGTRTGGGALSQSVTHGSAATAPTLTSPTGKVFSSWSTTFSSVTSTLTVTAIYVDATYTVTFDLDGGTRTGGGALSQSVTHGSAATAPTLTPPTGKVFSSWSTTFSSVTSNLTVTAIYGDASNTVTPSVSGSGSISPSVPTTVTYNATQAFTLTPAVGHVVADVSGTCGGSLSGNLFTTAAVTTNCTVVVRFEAKLKPTDSNGNAVASQQVVPRGAARSFKLSGGKGARTMTAQTKQAGVADIWNTGTVDDFLLSHGATLTENADGSYSFTASRSGRYSFTFTDEDGQQTTISFLVHPEAAFTSTHQYGSKGVEMKVTVALDDDPIDYPAKVPYTVDGSSLSPQLSATGMYQITSGRNATLTFTPSVNSGSITFDLIQKGLVNAVLGSLTEHTVTLVAPESVPLFVTLQAEQDGKVGTVEQSAGGLVSITSSLKGSGYRFDWSASDQALGLVGDGSTVTFDPISKEGWYHVILTVTELGGAGRTATAEIYIRVVTEIPDTFTAFLETPAKAGSSRLAICPEGGMDRVEQCKGVTKGIYLETIETFTIALGVSSDNSSWTTQEFGLAIEDSDVVNEQGEVVRDWKDLEYTHRTYRVDFEISGLELPGQSVPAVIPLRPGVTITENNVWRKYKDGKGWVNFEQDDRNSLASAKRNDAGDCPWAGASTGWTSGLNVGDDCVRLIIEDGGPNDLDGRADGVIRDPGALAVKADPIEVHTVGEGGGGGGGVIDRLLLLVAMVMLIQRRMVCRISPLKGKR